VENVATVIMAGGSGTRMNIGDPEYPKQFIRCFEGLSTFQNALNRASGDIFVFTNEKYLEIVKEQISDLDINVKKIIVEKFKRNTLTQFIYILSKASYDLVNFLPSDHLVDCNKLEISNCDITLHGVEPLFPNTGYGYLNKETKEFMEKPNVELASELIQNGWLWNSGIYSIRGRIKEKLILDYELNEIDLEEGVVLLDNSDIKDISFDNYISPFIEKREVSLCVEHLECSWEDIGETRRFIDNLSQYVVERPWGNYSVLDSGKKFKIKLITINPNGKLSLQSHNFRKEYWIIINGEVFVTKGNKTFSVRENEEVLIEINEKHSIENRTNEEVKIVEIQIGDKLIEEDIIRYSDIYGRVR